MLTQIMALNVSDKCLNTDNLKNAENMDRMLADHCTDIVTIKN